MPQANFDISRFNNQLKGWTATFNCPKCHTPLYSGMNACPQCGAFLGDTSNLNDPYEQEIEEFTASPHMKPEGSEHYFEVDGYGSLWGQHYYLNYGSALHENIYRTVAYDDSSDLLYYVADDARLGNYGHYLTESTIEEKNRRILYKFEQYVSRLVVNDSGIFVISAEDEQTDKLTTAILWLTKDGKEVKTIRLSGTIKQTYICGGLLFYIRMEKTANPRNDHNCGSAYWMNMRDEQEHCIIRAQSEAIRKNIKHDWENNKSISAEQIFGNEIGAVIQIDASYYDRNDKVPYDQVREDDSSVWYFYSFAEQQTLTCLNIPCSGSLMLYYEPERYKKWLEHCRGDWEKKDQQHPDGLSIIGFDMAKNLMWVAMKKNGRYCRVPMNITTDPKKRLRPDLPIWYEPPKEEINNRSWHEGTLTRDTVYFDGAQCYVSTSHSYDACFYSMNKAGECDDWPIREYSSRIAGFSVQGGQVFVAGILLLEHMGIPVPPEMKDDLDHECSALRFPAGHKFEKVLGYSFYGQKSVFNHSSHKDDEFQWLAQAFDEGKKADHKAYLAHLEEEKAGEKKQKEAEQQEDDVWAEFFNSFNQTSSDEEQKEPEKTVSAEQVTVKEAASHLEYWESFAVYAYEVLDSGMRLPRAADRNWYAIRLGSAKTRIECSVNSRSETLRTAFFIQDAPDLFAKVQQNSSEIEKALESLGDIIWDGSSRAANISLFTSQTGKSMQEQYEWFCNAANLLNQTIQPYLGT